MTIAMIPIDYGVAGREAVRLFDEKRNVLSGMIHGVNHLREELLVTPPGIPMENLLEKAIWCMNEFTTATNLPWSRAVVPPHEGVNPNAVAAMGEKGFEALLVPPLRVAFSWHQASSADNVPGRARFWGSPDRRQAVSGIPLLGTQSYLDKFFSFPCMAGQTDRPVDTSLYV